MTPEPRGNDTVSLPDAVGQTGRGPTRRQALVLAGGTAAALGAAVGPFSHLLVSGAAQGEAELPVEIVTASWLVGIELAAKALYETVGKTAGLDATSKALAATCGGHHDAQAKALGTMVTATGATAPSEANTAFTAQFQPLLDQAGDAAARAAVLAEMEEGFAATYLASLGTLTSSPLAGLAAQVLATDATHAVAWAAIASGTPGAQQLPSPDAVPPAQTSDAQFDQTALTPVAPTTTGDAS